MAQHDPDKHKEHRRDLNGNHQFKLPNPSNMSINANNMMEAHPIDNHTKEPQISEMRRDHCSCHTCIEGEEPQVKCPHEKPDDIISQRPEAKRYPKENADE